jgi:hypothetical protein
MNDREKGITPSTGAFMRESHAIDAEHPVQPVFRKIAGLQ